MSIFDEIIDRRGTNSYKWNISDPDMIPLWVADMDFRACRPILDALQRRLDIGVFGYTAVPAAFYEAIDHWFSTFHGWHIPAGHVIYTSGVVPAISAVIKALAKVGDKVLIQTPVYNCFFSSIRNNGCTPLESPLVIDRNTFRIDFDDMEHKAADPDCSVMLLCNPHNPAGRVWTAAELSKIADICRRNNVTVVSDEIHCELTFPGHDYTPFAKVAGDCRWVVCESPSKAFNIAGLQIAFIVSPDETMRAAIDRAININEVCDVNPFGVDALIAAYRRGRPWLEELLPYIYDNYLLLRDHFHIFLPELPIFELEGTYLAWIDCRAIAMSSDDLEERLKEGAGVWLNSGTMYGTDGEGFMRVNLACPRRRLLEALDRMTPLLRSLLTAAQ